MSQPHTIAVPLHILQRLLRISEEGIFAKVTWDPDTRKMDHACIEKRGEVLQSIVEELEALIPPNLQRP